MLFFHLEVTGLLNPDDEIHLFALHWAFLPQLQHQLNTFKEAWNLHRLRTENGRSPYQLWLQNREAADDLETVCLHILHSKSLKGLVRSNSFIIYSLSGYLFVLLNTKEDMLNNVCNQKALGHH